MKTKKTKTIAVACDDYFEENDLYESGKKFTSGELRVYLEQATKTRKFFSGPNKKHSNSWVTRFLPRLVGARAAKRIKRPNGEGQGYLYWIKDGALARQVIRDIGRWDHTRRASANAKALSSLGSFKFLSELP